LFSSIPRSPLSFFLIRRLPPCSPLFPYTTLFRSLQAWFARTDHPSARDPYFLYAASNAGSFLALIAYPFAIEPLIRLSEQRWLRSEEHTSELQSPYDLVCRLLLEKKKKKKKQNIN